VVALVQTNSAGQVTLPRFRPAASGDSSRASGDAPTHPAGPSAVEGSRCRRRCVVADEDDSHQPFDPKRRCRHRQRSSPPLLKQNWLFDDLIRARYRRDYTARFKVLL
jgi:hypothetical protein